MFHTIINVAYILPNIYIFFRIWKIFINKGHRIHYTLIYILSALIYPVSNIFSDRDTAIPAAILRVTGNYILPFYLYLFLFVLAFDIFLLINRIFKIVPPEAMKNIWFKIAGLVTIIFLPVVIVIAGVINFNTIRTSEYRIKVPKKSAKVDHLKIAFAADFHLRDGSNINFVERFVKKIGSINLI